MKKILVYIYSIILFISHINAVVIEVPPARWNQDIAVTGPTRVQADEFTLFEFIKLVNEYLWFIMWAILLAIFIYGWFILITAEWDAQKLSQANKILLGSGIGVLIVIFSYAIIRLIINLLW